METPKHYDLIIVGGGITGAALWFVIGRYSNLSKVALIEKYSHIAAVNSSTHNNSQTLHFGDIETNYPLERARQVKNAAEMVRRYVEKKSGINDKKLFRKTLKMVLAVGDTEIKLLDQRFEEFKELFPELKKIGREEIALVEPKIVEGRNADEKIMALCSPNGYAIDFGALSESFVETGVGGHPKGYDLFLGERVLDISKKNQEFCLTTSKRTITASAVVVAVGAHSLIFAQGLGYGKDFGILPAAGSFYVSRNTLKGKVYTIQNKKLPFAAVHGDPEVTDPQVTRFGPTTKILPLLERHNYATFFDFLKMSARNWKVIFSLLRLILDRTYSWFLFRNMGYELPVLGKWIYLQQVRKIVPSMKYRDVHLLKKVGGMRPQLVNIRTGKLEMNEAKIIGDNIIFDITPSPGASVCLKNAEVNARKIVGFLGPSFRFDDAHFSEDLQ